MSSLADRQEALVCAVRSGSAHRGLAPLAAVDVARGLQAYRHNAQGVAAKALGAVFEGVKAELGETSFEAMAWAFWRACPPHRGDLAQWGAELPAFLAARPGMDPVLCELAQLEWARHEAERAADVELDTASLTLLLELPPEQLRLLLRPGVSVVGSLLVWRRDWRARHRRLNAGEAVFMQALLEDQSLEAALNGKDFDFSAWLQEALREDWLLGVKEIKS